MKILLGLTGSVATVLYKKLIEQLSTIGQVDVIITSSARPFFCFEDLLCEVSKHGGRVYTDNDEWSWYDTVDGNKYIRKYRSKWQKNDPVLHISLRDQSSVLVIAPCSANTLAKLANGLCDNLLTCVARAWDVNRPVILAPAMNTNMWGHPITKQHLNKIESFGYKWVHPVSKMLACGTEGMGAMADINKIVDTTKSALRWAFPIYSESCSGIPISGHPGSFGVQRKHEKHTGVDLYTEDGAWVGAVENGTIVGIEAFTGPKDNSPWWNDTDCVLVEGASGVVVYGEIVPSEDLKIGNKIKSGEFIGRVKRVLLEGKERPDICGHKPNMLHMELYKHGQYKASHGFEDFILDPTPYLLDAIGRPKTVLS